MKLEENLAQDDDGVLAGYKLRSMIDSPVDEYSGLDGLQFNISRSVHCMHYFQYSFILCQSLSVASHLEYESCGNASIIHNLSRTIYT
jgi:hypothetical protein